MLNYNHKEGWNLLFDINFIKDAYRLVKMDLKLLRHLANNFTVGELYIFGHSCLPYLRHESGKCQNNIYENLSKYLYKPMMYLDCTLYKQNNISSLDCYNHRFLYKNQIIYLRKRENDCSIYKYSKEAINLINKINEINPQWQAS